MEKDVSQFLNRRSWIHKLPECLEHFKAYDISARAAGPKLAGKGRLQAHELVLISTTKVENWLFGISHLDL